jgi:hypothetical protein
MAECWIQEPHVGSVLLGRRIQGEAICLVLTWREGPASFGGENELPPVRGPCRHYQPVGRFRLKQRAGKVMADKKKPATRGRKPPEGVKKQFLTSMDPDGRTERQDSIAGVGGGRQASTDIWTARSSRRDCSPTRHQLERKMSAQCNSGCCRPKALHDRVV